MKNNKVLIVSIAIVILAVIAVGITFVKVGIQSNSKSSQDDIVFQSEHGGIIADFRDNKFDEAIESVDKLLVRNPDDITSLLMKADILLTKGSMMFLEEEYALKAQKIISRVLVLDVNNIKAYRLLGYSYEIQNMFEQALLNYDKSLAIKETSGAYHWKGHTYDLMGDILKAERFYEKALELDGDNQMALRNLSRVYLRLDKKDKAREILEKLIKMPVDNVSSVAGDYHSLGTIEFDEQHIETAKKLFEDSLGMDSSYMLSRVELAKFKILFEQGSKEAITELSVIVKEFPGQVAPMEWLGVAYLESDQLESAIESFEKAVELSVSDITLMGEQRMLIRSRLNYYLSITHSLKGNVQVAKEHLLKIMEGTDKSTMTMLIEALRKGVDGPYENIMADSEISELAEKLIRL